MYDDDEPGGSGLGGYAWFKLGEWSEQRSQNNRALADSLMGRSPVARADYNAVIEQNNSLAIENERLRNEIAKGNRWLFEWKDKCAGLKARADQQAAKLAEVTAQSNRQAEELKQALEWLDAAETKIFNLDKAYFEATGKSPPDWVNDADE